ncbi:hypothetical protein SAMN05192588_2612 [Nonlabens sp. Hel1_33_55]|uniref:YqiA/YcfP family alpha/beta fold hydrolase n=1 Tax=Nonlabens sp. Hel1_33_55 TaxID=1336802 RepID=UPI000875BA05|nr:alpha/beta hydrolase [Nonlabens sp. Hel1_33_55]SCY38704.1 hypothetical protein SAMN05192588_2612 [Nonlabens sp. Hel1_33_55]
MKNIKLAAVLFLTFSSQQLISQPNIDDKYIIFLHNAFLETHDIADEHPDHGRVEYHEILNKFRDNGFVTLSDKRMTNVNSREYAEIVVKQVDSLINKEVPAKNITVVGTSKGGYIAQYVSTIANNSELNYVFVGSFRESDIEQIPDINWCGNILNIYEKSDSAGTSGLSRNNNSTCNNADYEDLEINTGLGHGFLFRALDAWMIPAIEWANRIH